MNASTSNLDNIEDYLKQHENKGLLRFITCGSVDDGKSTLIGRLLHDSKMIYEDQLAALTRDSRTSGTRGGELDLALLVDGLQSEREQGITIDVAYRYFSTDRRKFIIADTPGHEQYTRNMATGASTAKLAVILIDARYGVQTQTRRHSYICDLLGIRHFVIAVNKMDLVDFDPSTYERIRDDYLAFAEKLKVQNIHFVPMSALEGDNVTSLSERSPWYQGQPLLELLETLDIEHDENLTDLRFPVQYVNRPNLDFRGFSGTLASGVVKPGQAIKVLPSGVTSNVRSIVTWDGEQEVAYPGQAITLTLDDEVDIARGDLIVAQDDDLVCGHTFEAHLVWMSEDPLEVGRRYDIKAGHTFTRGRIKRIIHQIDVNTLETGPAEQLPLNGIALCELEVQSPVALESYQSAPATGSLIVIDPMSHVTVGAGMVTQMFDESHITWHQMGVNKARRAERNHQKPAILWFTGLSGAGKSTIADALEKQLFGMGQRTYLLDGDNVRHGLCQDLGFDDNDREENIRRVGEVARLMVDAGLLVLVSFISPFQADRQRIRDRVEAGEFIEIFVDTPLEVCESRDPKGLYQKARAGDIPNFTGIDSPYEAPSQPEVHLNSGTDSVETCVRKILDALKNRGIID